MFFKFEIDDVYFEFNLRKFKFCLELELFGS